MESAKRLRDLIRAERGPRKVLEVPKSPWIKGASIGGPRMIVSAHIRREKNLISGEPPRATRFPRRLGVENHLHTSTISKGRRGEKGRRPQGPWPPLWPPSAAVSSLGCTSPSTSCSPWQCVSSLPRG